VTEQKALPQAVILLAGMGSRLGRPYPKSLSLLDAKESILARQIRILKDFGLSIAAVVGFKKDLVMEAASDLLFVYNPNYDTSNTSKSLLCALRHFKNRDVLWLNGDVVFDPRIIQLVLDSESSVVAVNNAKVSEEEVKYTVNPEGYINAISKQVEGALGEALGINLIKAEYLEAFTKKLEEVDDDDYFERAMEALIERHSCVFRAVDVSRYECVEVDFDEDLRQAKALVKHEK